MGKEISMEMIFRRVIGKSQGLECIDAVMNISPEKLVELMTEYLAWEET